MTQLLRSSIDRTSWRVLVLILLANLLLACSIPSKTEQCWQHIPPVLALQGRLVKVDQTDTGYVTPSPDASQWHFVADFPVCFLPDVIDNSGTFVRVAQFRLDGFQLEDSFIYLLEANIIENHFKLVGSLPQPKRGHLVFDLSLTPYSIVSTRDDVVVYLNEPSLAVPVAVLGWYNLRASMAAVEDLAYAVEPPAAGEDPGGGSPVDQEVVITEFPWPPPRASTTDNLPLHFFQKDKRLGDVANRIITALDRGEYYEKSFYHAPGGFAVVTRIEQIDEAGYPKLSPARWSMSNNLVNDFSLVAYLRKLFTADPGHFRIIVFLVTSESFVQSDKETSRKEAMKWLNEGWKNKLPSELAERPFTNEHRWSALVYEFEAVKAGIPRFITPSPIPGRHHLMTTSLWTSLEESQ